MITKSEHSHQVIYHSNIEITVTLLHYNNSDVCICYTDL